MNQEAININLSEKTSQESEFQRKVVESVRKYMKASANRMQQLHTGWDNNSYIYRGYRLQDKEDRDALKDGEPAKLIVPITYAQIQTAISFILSTYLQKDNIFELRGTGPEDEKYSFPMGVDLQYQLNDQKFIFKLYLWLLDALKQGVGIVRVDWEERKNTMRVTKQQPAGGLINGLGAIFGRKPEMQSVEAMEEVLCYQGNKITNISPYAFYPDPSVNLANFQDGMFVGHEDETSMTAIKALEGELYYGTDKIPDSINKDLFNERPRRVTGPFADDSTTKPSFDKAEGTKKVIRLDMCVTMSETEATKLWGGKLGTGKKPIKWLITTINDQKLVRFEKVGSFQDRYNYELFEFSPDHDAFFNPGLADTISELQSITTFFLNSHIVNVRKIIANRFIVDPNKVEMEDIKSGSIYIRTKGVQGDVGRAIQQLETSDITRTHIQDMQTLMSLVQVITGVNENALGQYSEGRRSATEARNVNAGAAARLKMHASLAWLQGIDPLGRRMLGNTRQWRTKEVYDMIVGEMALECPYEKVILANPATLAGGYDFMPYDATLPTDRQFQAQVLTELFTTLVQNPNTIQLLNKNPIKLLDHIAKLYNIRNLRDFDLQPLPPGASQGDQPLPALPATPTAQVVTDQQAADVAGAGAEPVDVNGEDLLRQLAGV